MTYFLKSNQVSIFLILILLGSAFILPGTTEGSPDDPPSLHVSKHFFPASTGCRYKDVYNCDSGDVERGTFTITYFPGSGDLVEGGAIKIRFGNIVDRKAYIVEDRIWPTPNLLDGTLPEYTTAIAVRDGITYPCEVRGVGECNDDVENCDGLPCCIYFCTNQNCLEELGKKASCDYIKVVTHQMLHFDHEQHLSDRIVITYGNDSISPNGLYRIPNLPLTESVILAERNGPSGLGNIFWPIHRLFPSFEYPQIEVGGYVTDPDVNAEVTDFEIIAPTTPTDGVVTLTVKAMQTVYDATVAKSMKNSYLVKNFGGKIRFSGSDPDAVYPPDYIFAAEDNGLKEFTVYFGENPTGSKTVEVCLVDPVTDECTDITGTSNPIVFEADSGNGFIYWGALQAHSMLGGHANQNPEFCYDFAKNISKLDFFELSEHCNTKYYNWKYSRNVCEAAYAPGEFVTFPGFEWTSTDWGHRHVIYKSKADSPATIPCESQRNNSVYLAESLDDFLSAIHDTNAPDAIIIPHHTARKINFQSPDWDYEWGGLWTSTGTGKQTLVEIFSSHGTSEQYIDPTPSDPLEQAENYIMENNATKQLPSDKHAFVKWALTHGYKFGIVSGSDNHAGTSGSLFGGDSNENNNSFYSRSGLTAVRAASLTREDIWSALKARKTYGTTGARIYLDFRINDGLQDHSMGESFLLDTQYTPTLHIDVLGTDTISDVWVVKMVIGGQLEETRVPESVIQYNGLKVQGSLPELNALPGNNYCYYIRIKQEDGHLAWSSPIWMSVPLQ